MAQKPDILDLILSDVEKEAVGAFVLNKLTMGAVKKVLLTSIYYNGTLRKDEEPDPTRNGAIALAMAVGNGQASRTNAELGEDLRAFTEGIRLLENGFTKLESLEPKKKSDGKGGDKANPAR